MLGADENRSERIGGVAAKFRLGAKHPARAVPLGPGGAVTLANVIRQTGNDLEFACTTYAHHAGLCVDPQIRIGDHERAHVYQYMALGPMFLPLYFVCGGVQRAQPLRAHGRSLCDDGEGVVATTGGCALPRRRTG
ncbi:hypothetical protein E4582_05170 [Luteimonas yindakuii]|uniref:DUF4157 domain-containing protein n=1 Tax=Luteimonas yindakuii TaxID=2565782 RepID=A0A4Z1RHP1_9GAMM|nr:hypothetical protein E4582_05170 [Luteimonas yindakuii]